MRGTQIALLLCGVIVTAGSAEPRLARVPHHSFQLRVEMRVLVVADMEGLSAVNDARMTDDAPRSAEYYAKGRESLHRDVNDCIEGLFDAGATLVDVVDGHGNGHNVQASRLDVRAKLLSQDTRRDLYFDLATRGTY